MGLLCLLAWMPWGNWLGWDFYCFREREKCCLISENCASLDGVLITTVYPLEAVYILAYHHLRTRRLLDEVQYVEGDIIIVMKSKLTVLDDVIFVDNNHTRIQASILDVL